jgi:hypothetical protein
MGASLLCDEPVEGIARNQTGSVVVILRFTGWNQTGVATKKGEGSSSGPDRFWLRVSLWPKPAGNAGTYPTMIYPSKVSKLTTRRRGRASRK